MIYPDELIEQYEKMVYKIIKDKCKKYPNHREDFISVGKLAILEAYRTYDKERGKISTYIWTVVDGRIRNYIRDNIYRHNMTDAIEEQTFPEIPDEERNYNRVEEEDIYRRICSYIEQDTRLSRKKKDIGLLWLSNKYRDKNESMKEIGNRYKISKQSVSKIILEIRDILKKYIKEQK